MFVVAKIYVLNGKGTILLHTVRQKPHKQTPNSDVVVPVVVVAAVVVVDSVVVIHGVVVGSETKNKTNSAKF